MPSIEIAGRTAFFDEQDMHHLDGVVWTVRKSEGTDYIQRCVYENGEYIECIQLHRLIMDCPDGMVVDHKNGNGLDNRRENMRVCTQGENSQNRKINSNNSSGFKGVRFEPHTRMKPWRARITCFGKRHSLGRFDTAEEAAEAYRQASAKMHGEFARKA